MNADKIKQLIDQENENLESQMTDEARGLIRQITQQQGAIARANERIAELRKELLALSHTPINQTDITGA